MISNTADLGICDQAVRVGSHIMYTFDSSAGSPTEDAVRFALAGEREGDLVVLIMPGAYHKDILPLIPQSLIRQNRFVLLAPEDVYLSEGRFSLSKVLGCWQYIRSCSVNPGEIRMFGCGDENTYLNRVQLLKLAEYESWINRGDSAKLTVCGYDTASSPQDLLEVVKAAHPYVCDGSQVQSNPCYLPPAAFFERFYTKETAEFTWPAEPYCCRLARSEVGEISGRMPFDLDEIDDLLVAVGEAFTNAIRHGSPDGPNSTIRLRVIPLPDRIAVEVIDEGCGSLCEEDHGDWTRTGGRGLFLMGKFCNEVQHYATGCGCTVRLIKHTTRSPL